MFNINGADFIKKSNTALMKDIDEKIKDPLYKKFTMFNPSVSDSETMEFLGQFPGMNEWISERQKKGLTKHKYTLINKLWESTVSFRYSKLKDNPAMVMASIPGLADAVIDHPTNLMFSVLGTNGTCYDGQPFFDNSHPYLASDNTESTYDNLLAQTGTTVANIQTDFGLAIAQFQGFKKRNGEPLFATVDKPVIVHSPALNSVMQTAFGADVISSNTNIYKGNAETISTGYLSGNAWYIFILNKAMKPFIYQLREKVTSEWNKQRQFDEDYWDFGVRARYNVGYGFPQLGIKIA